MFSRRVAAAIAIAVMAITSVTGAQASRIKDLVDVGGQRSNQLVGYGLVVGLNGTGDTIRSSPFTQQALKSMLERMGVGMGDAQIRSQNVAAVMVTADLPPFGRRGSKIDATVSTLGDSESLRGGTLISTALRAANGKVYAMAQGPVSAGGFTAQGQAAQVTNGVPTAGIVQNGAIIEREVPFKIDDLEQVRFALRDPDFTTAIRIADEINSEVGTEIAEASDSGTINARIPQQYQGKVAQFIARLENISVTPDQPARVVVDSRTGTVVIGQNVQIDRVAVSQGNLTIRVQETPEAEFGPPFNPGDPVTTPRTEIDVQEGQGKVAMAGGNANLQDLIDGLNSLGVGPRDLISILQTIDAQGALNAELVIR